ncbi:unnamed protein product, partial [Cyprideis torosa]
MTPASRPSPKASWLWTFDMWCFGECILFWVLWLKTTSGQTEFGRMARWSGPRPVQCSAHSGARVKAKTMVRLLHLIRLKEPTCSVFDRAGTEAGVEALCCSQLDEGAEGGPQPYIVYAGDSDLVRILFSRVGPPEESCDCGSHGPQISSTIALSAPERTAPLWATFTMDKMRPVAKITFAAEAYAD